MGNKNDYAIKIKSRSAFVAFAAVFLVVLIVVMGTLYYKGYGNRGMSEADEPLFVNGVTPVYAEGGWGYITSSGKFVTDPTHSLALGFSSTSKLALVYDNNNTEFSYIKKSGKVKAGPYESAGRCVSASFCGGYALIENEENGTIIYINKRGKQISAQGYEEGRSYKNGYAAVKEGNAWGYIGKRGKQKIPFLYDKARDFTDDKLAAVAKDGKWGYINKKNKSVIDASYSEAHDFSNGLAAVRDDDGWHYINRKGEIKISGNFDDVGDFASNGLAAVCENGKWGYINKKGKFVIEPQYKSADKFRKCGHTSAETDEGYRIINKRGKVLTKEKYSSISVYDDGYAVFSKNDITYGIMTCRGRIKQEPQYSFISFDRTYNYTVFEKN